MSQPFKFPRPPRPPPPAASISPSNDRGGRGGFNRGDRPGGYRGRGASSSPYSGRGSNGRGGRSGMMQHHGQSRGGFGRGFTNSRPNDHDHAMYAGQRTDTSWQLSRKPRPNSSVPVDPGNARGPSRPSQPAPAVPAFGGPLFKSESAVIQSRDSPQDPSSPKKPVKLGGLLGLRPADDDQDESEDDLNEESRLGQDGGSGKAPLRFEYNGVVHVLDSPAAIAKYIQERKSRFPTIARIDEHKKQQQQKRKELADAKRDKKRDRKPGKDQQAKRKKAKADSWMDLTENMTLAEFCEFIEEQTAAHPERREMLKGLFKVKYKVDYSSDPDDDISEVSSVVSSDSDRALSDTDSFHSAVSSIDSPDAIVDDAKQPNKRKDQLAERDDAACNSAAPTSSTARGQCAEFQRTGKCKYGANCRWKHGGESRFEARRRKQAARAEGKGPPLKPAQLPGIERRGRKRLATLFHELDAREVVEEVTLQTIRALSARGLL